VTCTGCGNTSEFSDTNELTLGEYFYESDNHTKGLSRRGLRRRIRGCTDLKPIQAQIDDLKSQVSKLQGDTARTASQAAAAQAAANSAQSAAAGAQSTANQALSTAQANSTAIEAINEKIDRMFKKSVSK